jgi:hemerythrin-like metal-binding protein
MLAVHFGGLAMNIPHTENLHWNEALALDIPLMDDTHREFVDLLAAVLEAPDAQILHTWLKLIAHTQEHFKMEEKWMIDTGFASGTAHATQHQVILQVMREGESRGRDGEAGAVRQMAHELGLWFPKHAEGMDAELALHMQATGYDPHTGKIARPQAPLE